MISHMPNDMSVKAQTAKNRYADERTDHKRRPVLRNIRRPLAEPQRKSRPQCNRQHNEVRQNRNSLFSATR
jgi:hypothetical protein